MLVLSLINVSLAHVSHRATLRQTLGKVTRLRAGLAALHPRPLVFPAPAVQSSETLTIALAILLGILSVFLLLGTTLSSKSTSSWERMERSSLPHFVKFDHGSSSSSCRVSQQDPILLFSLLSCKGTYCGTVPLHLSKHIWSRV